MDIVNKKTEQTKKDDIINKTFFNKYHCIEKIGKGSFGSIYKAEYNGEYYALKFEKIEKSQNLLENEAVIMNYLKGPNVPYIKFYGSNESYNVLVIQLLGKSLENLFEEKKIFSLKTVCMLGYQMVSILENVHNKHILHRDIKPDNFVMGINSSSQYVYLLDFGLAKKYRSSKTLRQIPLINRNRVVGTTRYISINALKGLEHSRRDDLEALGYVLIYFIKGHLPWQGITSKDKVDRYRKLLKKKIEVSPKELCEGLPEEFERYVSYTRNLDYYEDPDYEMLKGLFTSMMNKANYIFDYIYDWTSPEESTMRRVGTYNSEIESNLNKKSTFHSSKYIGENEYYNKKNLDISFDASKKNILDSKINNENVNVYNIKNNNQFNEDEDAIIISKRKDYLNTIIYDEDEVCCTSGCILF